MLWKTQRQIRRLDLAEQLQEARRQKRCVECAVNHRAQIPRGAALGLEPSRGLDSGAQRRGTSEQEIPPWVADQRGCPPGLLPLWRSVLELGSQEKQTQSKKPNLHGDGSYG
ncbi:hypothetical protein HPB47_015631 [Ixodes persulcatus]|uniref:Uncharacterized protein n=1 Tax=Ixodes persulcatus TaxID=34615 RepID=A0AC60QSY8_IXOPE|nr:hypothetical protein HPB47_015631 [Ixodes persulcatus]